MSGHPLGLIRGRLEPKDTNCGLGKKGHRLCDTRACLCKCHVWNKDERQGTELTRILLDRDEVIALFTTALDAAIARHTAGGFIHPMEGLGSITVEYHELMEAVHERDGRKTRDEALDLAVVAAWLAGSIDNGSAVDPIRRRGHA